MGILEIKPLSAEEVDALRSSRATNGLPLPTEKLLDQLLETVRDRERQRDALLGAVHIGAAMALDCCKQFEALKAMSGRWPWQK